MGTIYLPIVVAFVGALLYALTYEKVPALAALAKDAWWVGLLVTLLYAGWRLVHLP